MKRIVVGADGSTGAANGMRWASRIAWAEGAEVVVVTGFTAGDSELPPGRVEALVAEQEKELAKWSEAAVLGDVTVRRVVERGDPRNAIMAVATREDADLIVVGRRGTSAGPGLFSVGSVAEWLAHHIDRPLAVIGGAVSSTTRSATVGIDGSAGSAAALAWVAALNNDIRLVLTAVHQPYVEWTHASSPHNWRRDVEEKIRTEWASGLTDVGRDFTALAVRGSSAASALLHAAQDERTDIIVVGMRGLGGFSGLRLGGVAVKILHHADRPVILVPTS